MGGGCRMRDALHWWCQMKEGRAELKRKIPVPRASMAAGRANNSDDRNRLKSHECGLTVPGCDVKT
jgi:hypothetical protein